MRTYLVCCFFVSAVLCCGCKKEIKPVQNSVQEINTPEPQKEIAGERFGFLKQITKKDGRFYASVVFLSSQTKNKNAKINSAEALKNFSDSLAVIELPDEFLFCAKGKIPETYLIDSSAKIVMQTLSYTASGNYHFNERIDETTLYNVFTTKSPNRFSKIPFKFNFIHSAIQSIEEKYIP